MSSKINREILGFFDRPGFKCYKMFEIANEVNLYNKMGFIEKPNSVYLPKIGNSPAVTLISELKIKPHNYIQIVFKKEKVNSNYLASFFNTNLGIKVRNSLKNGTYIPKINKKNLISSEICLPELNIQNEVLNAESKIREVSNELEIEKRNLWNDHRNAQNVQKKFVNIGFNLEEWINSLPFPLASILWAYDSELDGMIKFKYLLRFFEAFSQFNSIFLLSAVKKDEEFYITNFKKCLDKMHDKWFLKPDFGSWNLLGMCLSKKIRVILEKDDINPIILNNLFGTPNNDFFKMITNKKIYQILEKARDYRNKWDAHDTPSIPLEDCTKRTEILFNLLLDLKDITSDLYNTILFFLPIKGNCKSGQCFYEIKKLKGPNSHFKKDKIPISPSVNMLDEEMIYFINEGQLNPIELISLIRIQKSPHKEANACYYYNRVENEKLRLVTYHYKNKYQDYIEYNPSKLVHLFS